MKKPGDILLDRLTGAIEQLIMGDVPEEIDCSGIGKDEFINVCEAVNRL
jgi:hypothetical protein